MVLSCSKRSCCTGVVFVSLTDVAGAGELYDSELHEGGSRKYGPRLLQTKQRGSSSRGRDTGGGGSDGSAGATVVAMQLSDVPRCTTYWNSMITDDSKKFTDADTQAVYAPGGLWGPDMNEPADPANPSGDTKQQVAIANNPKFAAAWQGMTQAMVAAGPGGTDEFNTRMNTECNMAPVMSSAGRTALGGSVFTACGSGREQRGDFFPWRS